MSRLGGTTATGRLKVPRAVARVAPLAEVRVEVPRAVPRAEARAAVPVVAIQATDLLAAVLVRAADLMVENVTMLVRVRQAVRQVVRTVVRQAVRTAVRTVDILFLPQACQ